MDARTDTAARDAASRPAPVADPVARRALRRIRLLIGMYLGISTAAMVAIVALRDDPAEVTDAVWIRAGIVLLSATLTLSFAVHAARGSRPAYRRLRIVTALMLVAVIVIVALPGAFPVWLRLEQAACGICLLGVVLLANGRSLRTAFAGGR